MEMSVIISHMLRNSSRLTLPLGSNYCHVPLKQTTAFIPATSCSAAMVNYSKEIYLIFPLFESL